MVDLAVYAIPIFLVTLVIESAVTARRKVLGYERRDTAASLAMGVGNLVVDLIFKGVTFAAFAFCHRFALFEMRTDSA